MSKSAAHSALVAYRTLQGEGERNAIYERNPMPLRQTTTGDRVVCERVCVHVNVC